MVAANILLIYPMCALVLLTFFVLVVMFLRRVDAVRSGKVPIAHFKTFTVGEAPEDAVKAARHFTNLFEMPVLFYVACVVGMVLPVQGPLFLVLAWLFVAGRVMHAGIHLGSNKMTYRMSVFAFSVAVVLAMWVLIFLSALSILP